MIDTLFFRSLNCVLEKWQNVLEMLLDCSLIFWKNWVATLNLLIEACKLYVNCELFITERHLLAINCIEKSIQEELLKKFSKFHCDFLNHDMGTLQDFQVNYKHVTFPALATE